MTAREIEIDAMADALVLALQPFARKGSHPCDAISACVGVIIKVATEYGEAKHPDAKFAGLTEAISLLQETERVLVEQAREWQTINR